jgi:pimeloyl-ACP methyl ester carboxylesterase
VTLTVADIDRWSSEAVRAVFRAATERGQATLEVSRQLASLAVFDTWKGKTAEARKHTNASIRQDLDAHGNESLAVGRAADKAADGIDKVQAQLRGLRADAAELHMWIDPLANKVVPSSAFNGPPTQALIAEEQLQPRLDAILAEANAVDEELAAAINMADGDVPIPADVGPSVGPQGLTPTQRASDANEVALREERARTQGDIERMQRRLGEMLATDHDWNQGALDDLTASLAAAKNRLTELDAVTEGLSKAPETYLAQLDIPHDYSDPVHAAIAVGNPDTATNVSVTVPGVGSSTKDTLPGMVTEARNLRDTAQDELRLLGRPGSVATVAWMGYDPPANPERTTSPRDLWRVMNDYRAQAGASSLSAYLKQLDANNPNAHVSLLGHSYGSLTASLALQQLHQQGVHAVDDAVFYGSPGLEITSPGQLGLDSAHAFVMQYSGDPITEKVAPLAPLHGWGLNPYAGMMPELSSQAGISPDGVPRSGVHGHAEYPRADLGPGGQPVLKMSGYNLAVIAAGIADMPGGGKQLVMAPTPGNPQPHPGG